jgi:hypothetical protein
MVANLTKLVKGFPYHGMSKEWALPLTPPQTPNPLRSQAR